MVGRKLENYYLWFSSFYLHPEMRSFMRLQKRTLLGNQKHFTYNDNTEHFLKECLVNDKVQKIT